MCPHLKNGIMLHVDFDSTAIDRFYNSIGVLLGEFSRQIDIDKDPIDPFGVRILFTPHGKREIFCRDVSILAERKDINPRTCPDRD